MMNNGGEAVPKYANNTTTRNVPLRNVGVQGIEPAEISTQPVIITDSISIYYGVRSQARFVKSGRKALRPYTPNVADIVLAFGISGQPRLSEANA
ncbi:MAG: hypothetical protein PHC50_01140 [Candidatus Cloacimonetes bacterium]|nr:hypothetical protein [Candidatus Cloacimonadota bacterium]